MSYLSHFNSILTRSLTFTEKHFLEAESVPLITGSKTITTSELAADNKAVLQMINVEMYTLKYL